MLIRKIVHKCLQRLRAWINRLVKVRIVTRRADVCLLWDGGRAIHSSYASIFRGMILPDP
jgi:hypothetical protein